MKPICVAIRGLIVRARGLGKTNKEIAYLYSISLRTVVRICRLYQKTGNLVAQRNKGRPSRLTQDKLDAILSRIETQPDITLSMLIEALELPIKKSQLHRILKKRGFSYKKKHFIPKPKSELM